MDDEAFKDVHTEHCCAVHGCKYMDSDCTVYDSAYNRPLKKQSFICETCEHRRYGDSPYETFDHLNEEPVWFTVSETQISPFNTNANAKCAVTRLALIRLLGSQERYQKALEEMREKCAIILREWFPL